MALALAAARAENEVEEPRFSGHTLAEMLDALRQAATNEARGLEALEVLAARQQSDEAGRVFETAADDVRRHGIALGATHALLMALLPHQDELAALVRRDVSGSWRRG